MAKSVAERVAESLAESVAESLAGAESEFLATQAGLDLMATLDAKIRSSDAPLNAKLLFKYQLQREIHRRFYPRGHWYATDKVLFDIRFSVEKWFREIANTGFKGEMSSNTATTWVQERRLRPIYELLDAGNNKKVIQEVDRLLKKSPNFPCAKVLKGLALIRQNKKMEADAILEDVSKEVPTDDGTIQALSICYRELEKPEKLCLVLEAACEKDKSEELLTHCFMAQVRLSDHQKMYKTALQLYKLYNKTTYYGWAVASLLYKYEFNVTGSKAENVSITLADRMMDKFFTEQKSSMEENFLDLYMRICMKRADWNKMYDVLKKSGYPQPVWKNDNFHVFMCTSMTKLKKSDELFQYLKTTYMKNPDEYDLLHNIVESFGESAFDKVQELLMYLRENYPNRAVALGDLFFINSFCADTSDLSRIEEDLAMAIKYGADKPSFFSDVGQYFGLVGEEAQFRLVNLLAPTPDEGSKEPCLNSIPKIIKDVNFEMLFKEMIGQDKEGSCRLRQANACFGKYLMCEELQDSLRTEEHLRTKESDYHDQYLVLAATNLLEDSYKSVTLDAQPKLVDYLKATKWTEIDDDELIALRKRIKKDRLGKWNEIKNDDDHLAEDFEQLSLQKDDTDLHLSGRDALITFAISILEYGLARSPYNYSMRILLNKAYGKLGAVHQAIKVMQGLDLKHVQWDTLGYLIFPQAFNNGTYQDALRMAGAAHNMYSSYKRESMEHVIAAYKYGSFCKVGEFLSFRTQLLESISYVSLMAERDLMEYMLALGSHQDLLKLEESIILNDELADSNTLADNRDFTVLQSFDEEVDLKSIKESTADLAFFSSIFRYSLLCLIARLVKCLRGADKIDMDYLELALSSVEKRIPTWNNLYQFDTHAVAANTPQFHAIFPPLIARNFRLGTFQYLIDQTHLAIAIIKSDRPDLKSLQILMLDHADELLKTVRNNYGTFLKIKELWVIEYSIHDFHIVLETFSFMRIILDVAITTAKSHFEISRSRGAKERNNKLHLFKKSASYTVNALLEKYEELHRCFIDFIAELKARPLPSMKHIGDSLQSMLDDSFLIVAFQTEFPIAQKNIRESHLYQLNEMRKVSALLVDYIRNNLDS